MKGSRAATRYAKSFLRLSIEKGVLEKTYADMKAIDAVLKESRDLVNMLKSPIVKTDTKVKVLREVLKDLNEITLAFVVLITRKKREGLLEYIVAGFLELYKEYKGILTAEVVAATAISEPMRKKILALIGEKAGTHIELIEKVDASLIGGFIIKFGDKQYDASVAHRLKELRKTFSENPFIPEL